MTEGIDLKALLAMAHSPLRNYIIPGLTSSLIGNPSLAGTIRLFESEREHQETVVPHSHRFDFQCWVLAGAVTNRIWTKGWDGDREADWYAATELRYAGAPGEYARGEVFDARWTYRDTTYAANDWYRMKADAVHSIRFGRGAKVLFFEGPTISETSIILEPMVDGRVIETMKIEPWMFKR